MMTDTNVDTAPASTHLERPRNRFSIPAEGTDNLFTQSWFPICLSTEVSVGSVIGKDFLDGQVVIFRGEDGIARVFSAYCLHMGANLANGKVIGNELRCAFHHWEYDGLGQCIRTGVGDKPPARAKLFSFPTEEHCGIIFAFNGVSPLYPFPALFEDGKYTPDELLISTHEDPRPPWPVDPWSIRGNTPDWAHFACVHHMSIADVDRPDPETSYQYDKYTVKFDAPVNRQLPGGVEDKLVYKAQITGTTLWHNHGTFNGRWHFLLSALGIPKPGTSSHYYVTAVHKGNGSDKEEAEARELVAEITDMWETMLDEDHIILRDQHYDPGLLTEADASVVRFLQFVKTYPRAHPAYHFMR